jgi:hypothetical protein
MMDGFFEPREANNADEAGDAAAYAVSGVVPAAALIAPTTRAREVLAR